MLALHRFLLEHNDIAGLRRLLRDENEDVNSRDLEGRTPLHRAVIKCELNPEKTEEILLVVQELINHDAIVDLKDREECTPLDLAVMCRNCRLIETLLVRGAQINTSSKNSYTTLHHASKISSFPRDGRAYKSYEAELGVVQILLRTNPDIDFLNGNKETALMLAVQDDHYLIVCELLKKGASVNIHDAKGSYPMHFALDSDEVNVKVVIELAIHGGVFTVRDGRGITPVYCYLEKLIHNSPIREVKNTLLLFKLFLLQGFNLARHYEGSLILILYSLNMHLKLAHHLTLYHNEYLKMAQSELAQDLSVRQVVQSLVFTSKYENENHVPFVVLDKLLKKLQQNEFPKYAGIIVSGIRRPYLNVKFAEMCCNRESAVSFFEFEALFSISKYLTNMEMLLLMRACLQEKPANGWPSFSLLSRCSIL